MTKAPFVFLLSSLLAGILSAGEREPFLLEWSPVEDAAAYRLLLKPSQRKDLLILGCSESSTSLYFPAGFYRFRLEALDAEEQRIFRSDWHDLEIPAPSASGGGASLLGIKAAYAGAFSLPGSRLGLEEGEPESFRPLGAELALDMRVGERLFPRRPAFQPWRVEFFAAYAARKEEGGAGLMQTVRSGTGLGYRFWNERRISLELGLRFGCALFLSGFRGEDAAALTVHGTFLSLPATLFVSGRGPWFWGIGAEGIHHFLPGEQYWRQISVKALGGLRL